MAETLYTIDILRLAASVGKWPPLTQPHGTAERRSPTCGSRVRADVMLAPDNSLVALGLSVSACALGQASAAILASEAVGKGQDVIAAARSDLAAFLGGSGDRLPDWPGMTQLAPARGYPARHPSILLAFDAVLAAMETVHASAAGGRAHG
jgi:NifU-like protein involved in Fe-S cluster formation